VRNSPTITFLGATGTVTGSKYLLESAGTRVLVDCGLFQGKKSLRQRNWQALPIDATSLDAVLLTHAHLDHSGYLPVLRKGGFTGPVYCTPGTAALVRVLLVDSGHLQEEDARYATRKGFSKHHPALPLYTRAEAEVSLSMLRRVPFNRPIPINDRFCATFHRGGHILGASWIEVNVDGVRVTFSGDVGRPGDPVMNPPSTLQPTDYLIIESTYGNRRHHANSALDELQAVVKRTVSRGGILVIPAFAVGRTQTVLHLLACLRKSGAIPDVPVFLNSPMAMNATEIFCAHADEHRLTPSECSAMCDVANYVRSADDSRALNRRSGPMIVISASGMATGGRILHHLKAWVGDPRNTVLFTGFQAAGTRGAAMLAGAQKIRIHGQSFPVRAEIAEISGFSAHADYEELTDWVAPLKQHPPKTIFVTHGEPAAAAALRDRLSSIEGLHAEIPTEHQMSKLI
jgi:metallo-beta-lactamase family protein